MSEYSRHLKDIHEAVAFARDLERARFAPLLEAARNLESDAHTFAGADALLVEIAPEFWTAFVEALRSAPSDAKEGEG